jgi:hypothetical protein
MAERRKYVELFEDILQKLDAGIDQPIGRITYSREYRDPVADRFVDKLGLLPGDLPELIVRFYAVLSGLRLDLDRMSDGEFNLQAKAKVLREDLGLWRDNVILGKDLIEELQRVAHRWRTLWRYLTG